MKITLSIDSKEPIELSLSDAANIVGWLDDDEKYASFFSLLAAHPSSEVRCVVANKRCVSLKVLKLLARDSSIEVVRTVAANEGAMQQFKVSLIQEMIALDVSVAMTIADYMSFYSPPLPDEVIQTLLQHDDPKVVNSVFEFERNQSGED